MAYHTTGFHQSNVTKTPSNTGTQNPIHLVFHWNELLSVKFVKLFYISLSCNSNTIRGWKIKLLIKVHFYFFWLDCAKMQSMMIRFYPDFSIISCDNDTTNDLTQSTHRLHQAPWCRAELSWTGHWSHQGHNNASDLISPPPPSLHSSLQVRYNI